MLLQMIAYWDSIQRTHSLGFFVGGYYSDYIAFHIPVKVKDTGLSVALFISVVITSSAKSIVSLTIPCTYRKQKT